MKLVLCSIVFRSFLAVRQVDTKCFNLPNLFPARYEGPRSLEGVRGAATNLQRLGWTLQIESAFMTG